MNSRPLVSVIMIFLNAERFILEAIESVFAQTYSNWELLLVDDGSTDGSTEIALRFAKNSPEKVRYLEHDGHRNRGTGASRNLGIFHAKGDYIAQLDADDVWFPQTLEQQVAIFASQPEVTMVFGNRQYWRSWTGNPDDRDSISEHGIESNTLLRPPTLLTLIYGLGKTSNPDSDVMFRREIAIRLGGFEESFRGMFEDQVFLVKVFLNEAVFVSKECWTKYRQHPDSCVAMAIKSGQYHNSRESFLLWIEEYLSQHGMKGTPVWETTQKALWVYRHPVSFRLLSLMKTIAQRILPLPIRRLGRAIRQVVNTVRQ